MNEWKTIDSAPRDGTRILGYDGVNIFVTWVSHYYNTRHNNEIKFVNGLANINTRQPTHWMPLPSSPTNK